MSQSVHLALPLLAAEQAQKHVTVNEALGALDVVVQLSVKDRSLAAPPGAPANGDRYIVAAVPTGAWAGHAGDIAAWQDGAWAFYGPREGWLAWVDDEDVLLAYNGGIWVAGVGGSELQSLSRLGLGTAADATNPFSAKLNNALWTARTVAEGGDGDLRYKMSKETAADTLSLLLQTAFSGRAEIGLAGDDDLSFKVSADGSTWKTGLVLDRATGRVSFPSGGAREVLTANRTYYVKTAANGGSDANDGLTAGAPFLTIQKAINVVAALDIGTFTVTLQVGGGSYAGATVPGPWVGSGTVSLQGENTTGFVLTGPIVAVSAGRINVSRVKLQGSPSVYSRSGATINQGANVEFGATAGQHMLADGGTINVQNSYTISGGAGAHHLAQVKGMIIITATLTVMISGTPAIAIFAQARDGTIWTAVNTYAGATTGKRYDASLNGVINTFGGGPNYFPGEIAGSASTGGQYA